MMWYKMAKPTAYVVYGLGIGCHGEVIHAFERAGANAEKVHIKALLSGEKDIFDSQIIDKPGGFEHGDILGSAMCAANELEHALINRNGELDRLKDLLWEYAQKGNVIYAQCNGFQWLVKSGLLPAIDGDYSQQTVTLAGNNCGVYRVTPTLHKIERPHFAFEGIDDSDLYLWCRHGEGKIQFYSEYGLVSKEEGEESRRRVNEDYVLLRYVDPNTGQATEQFPYNPNGSVDGIAGLANGNIFGHMCHTEVSVYSSRDPRFFERKDELRRRGIKATALDEKLLEGIGLKVYQNIVNRVR